MSASAPKRSVSSVSSLEHASTVADGKEKEERQSATFPSSYKTEKMVLSGFLMKQGAKGPIKLWRNRWFIFDDRRCCLLYYRSQQDFVPLGSIDISAASFSFEVETLDKGQFKICVKGRDYQLQAQSKSAMEYWLKELRERRRAHSKRRLRNPAASRRRGHQLAAQGGLTGSAAEPRSALSAFPEGTMESAASNFGLDWSFLNRPLIPRSNSTAAGQKASQAAAAAKAKALQRAKEQKQQQQQVKVVEPDGGDETLGKKKSFSLNFFPTWKKLTLKRPLPPPVVHQETGQSKKDFQPDNPLSPSTTNEAILVNLQDDVEAMEREIAAKNEVIKRLTTQLNDVQIEKFASEQFIATETEQERLRLLVKRDHKIVQVEIEKQALEEEKMDVEQKAMELQHKLDDSFDQMSMFKEMLLAKDQVVMKLTNQIFELEQKDTRDASGSAQVAALEKAAQRQELLSEVQSLKDKYEAYKMQNTFLNSEVLELNRLREDDEETTTAMADKLLYLESDLCKLRSQNLLLLEEVNKPKRGGVEEEGLSQEMISKLLEDAMSSEFELGDMEEESADPSVDRYGFRKSVSGDGEDAIRSAAQKLKEQSQQLEHADTGHLVRWENYLLQRGKRELEFTSELKQLIRAGIPHEHRNEVWLLCIHALTQDQRAEKGKGYYRKLLEWKNTSVTDVFYKQIELDLLRTMPNNKYYDSPDAAGIAKLRNVLRAYSCHNPTVGYCQGINRLVAVALLYMDEEDAFWCLTAIIDALLPRDYYNQTLLASQVEQRVFREIFGEKLPRLNSHFEAYNIDLSLITFNWFLTIFVDNTPMETTLRIWDSFLYEGTKVLFRYALAIFKLNEDSLLSLTNPAALFNATRNLTLQALDLKRLAHIAFVEMNPFPMRNIRSKRTTYLTVVKTELAELENLRSRHQRSYSFQPRSSKHSASDDEC
eukprot:m.179668 g.179668  ORF g.179668 m.179668 type:complete len:936 (+) comp39227_c0_seq9:595-3402(+)